MSEKVVQLHPEHGGAAATSNVALCQTALERVLSREEHLPGLIAFYGPSGYGKSMAAAASAAHFRAYFVQVKSTWTAKALLLAILKEMGIKPTATIYEMAEQAAEQLALSRRPLIIDEFDFLVTKKSLEVVRDLHEASGGGAILLIGEEYLERNLRPWERFHNRVLQWVPAQPATLEDCQQLARHYAPGLTIEADLLERVRVISRGITRRVAVNLAQIIKHARSEGLARIDLAGWGNLELDSGDAPKRTR